MLGQQILNGLTIGSVYALFSLGFTLVFSVHRILNLAHGAVFMWGAFFGLYAITKLGAPLPVAVLFAGLGSAILNVILDLATFRLLRRRNSPEFATMVISLGSGLILMNLAQRLSETRVLRYPFGTFPLTIYEVMGLRISFLQMVIMGSVVVVLGFFLLYLYATSFGRQIRAVAASESTAQLLGVNPTLVFMQTFAISGALAGVAGLLIGNAYNSVSYLMGQPYLLTAFVVVVIGGLGSIIGAVVAGLLVGIVHSLSIAYIASDLRDAIVFGATFLVLLVRPTGLFGQITSEKRVGHA
jgi:branched-chain amino acid transport system permease protein